MNFADLAIVFVFRNTNILKFSTIYKQIGYLLYIEIDLQTYVRPLRAASEISTRIEIWVKNKHRKMAKASRRDAKAPSAWVVAPKDRGRKSVKFDAKSDTETKGKVYLNDGEEFQIELHNPLAECALADIKLNGSSISKGGLVLRPGERFYLDCFIDDKKKFIFSTYEVEDTDDSMESIAKNGLLEVFFYKESAKSIDRSRLNKVIVERHYYPYQTNPYWQTTPWYTTPNIYCNTGNIGTTFTNTSSSNATYTSSSVNLNNLTGTLTTGNTMPINSSLYSANIETGRVEKGDRSAQKFDEVDMDFDSFYISSTVLELLPESRRPIETKELKEKPEQNKQPEAIELIKKLAELKDAGILTEEEFSNKKAELLGRI
jgi:hypothetical protein